MLFITRADQLPFIIEAPASSRLLPSLMNFILDSKVRVKSISLIMASNGVTLLPSSVPLMIDGPVLLGLISAPPAVWSPATLNRPSSRRSSPVPVD